MDRRNALKNMGLALGYTVATPTLISLVQSCKAENAETWVPKFFSPGEGHVLKHVVDLILPRTDTPSASDVNVHIFIDSYADEVLEEQFRGFMKLVLGKFTDKALAASGKEDAAALTQEDLEPVLAAALNQTEEQEKANQEAIGKYMAAAAEGGEAELDADAASATFASTLREFAIFSYKTTEYIGEEVLAYLPVPGPYIACGDVEELSGGMDWSLSW